MQSGKSIWESEMWIFTLNSFVSVVRHREKPELLLVRARRKKDLVELLGKKWKKEVFEDGLADYRFRVIMPEKDFQGIVADYISNRLTYDNFKAAQKPDDEFLHFLHKVWGMGMHIQEALTD
jgi:hypothetical protein